MTLGTVWLMSLEIRLMLLMTVLMLLRIVWTVLKRVLVMPLETLFSL